MPHDLATRVPSRTLGIALAILLIGAAAIVIGGLIARAHTTEQLREWTDQQSLPTVALIAPQAQGDGGTLDLPGRLEAYYSAPIYARVSGYLKDWKVDIGAPVKAGQVLAEIETPDLDQQILQARADLATAKANADLATITAKRWQSLVATGAVAKQDADEKVGDETAKLAMVKSAQANLDHMLANKEFARIVAPFAGVVTARQTDVGALINAGAGAAGQELFTVSDTRKLRVYVSVPQLYVPDIPQGAKATITVPEQANRHFDATVESSAHAVNAASGSTLMQLGVDNAKGELMPGEFATISFALPHKATLLIVPASAVMFDKAGLRVAVVDADNKVMLKTVTIAQDLGKTIVIGSGLSASDRVVESPPDGVADGDLVRIAGTAQKKAER
jgi:RND family efflux transporter MFP subunit